MTLTLASSPSSQLLQRKLRYVSIDQSIGQGYFSGDRILDKFLLSSSYFPVLASQRVPEIYPVLAIEQLVLVMYGLLISSL